MIEWIAKYLTEWTGEYISVRATTGLIIFVATFILVIIFGRMCNQCAKEQEKEAERKRLKERKERIGQ